MGSTIKKLSNLIINFLFLSLVFFNNLNADNGVSPQETYLPSEPRVCYSIETIVDSGGTEIFNNRKFVGEINTGEEYTFNIFISNMKKNVEDTDIEIADEVQIYLNMTNFDYTADSTFMNNIDNIHEANELPRKFRLVTDSNATFLQPSLHDDLGEHIGNQSTWRIGAGADIYSGGQLRVASNFSDSKYITYAHFKGALTVADNSESIDLSNYFKFKASFQTDSITIDENNTQIIAQCQNLNSTGTVETGLGGLFNVVMTDQTPNFATTDPMSVDDSPLNALPTQVSNKPFNISILALNDDKITLQKYHGLVTLELIAQPKYSGDEDKEKLEEMCKDAKTLYPLGSEPTITFAFLGTHGEIFSHGTFNFPSASKDTSFRVKYLKKPSGSGALEATNCTANNNACIWEMINNNYKTAPKPCEDECKGTTKTEACTVCAFGGTLAGSVCARDNFAIRPDKFILAPPQGEDIQLLKSGNTFTFPLIARQYNTNNGINNATLDYNLTNAQEILNNGDLDINKTIFAPDNTIPNPVLKGTLSFANAFNFADGSSTAGISFTDVGKVNIKVIDTHWTKVDIDQGDNPLDCSANGAYICGDVNATYIPDHFTLTNASLFNTGASTYTYLSNDLNVSAEISVTVTATNSANVTTQNFSVGAWENPVDITFTLPATAITGLVEHKKEINATQKLGFVNGQHTINSTDTNTSAKLIFNYNRDVNNPQNPFMVNGADITLNTRSTYTSTTPASPTSPIAIVSNVSLDKNATFIYGRTHAPRYIFTGNLGRAFIYYEAYCSGTINANPCVKELLPNGVNSNSTDDPRWYINRTHIASSGVTGAVVQKGSTYIDATLTSINPANVALSYTGSSYPYKATMQNSPSLWLVYDKYKVSPTTNEFEVEFINTHSNWAGKNETDTTTINSATNRTNRRSMW